MTKEIDQNTTRNDFFDGFVPQTPETIKILEKAKQKEMLDFMLKLQRGNMRQNPNSHKQKTK